MRNIAIGKEKQTHTEAKILFRLCSWLQKYTHYRLTFYQYKQSNNSNTLKLSHAAAYNAAYNDNHKLIK